MSDFPSPAEGRRAWDAGRADARANRQRSAEHDRPRRLMSFRQGCIAAAYLQGYNHGTQEALQDAYGDAPTT